MPDLTPRLGIKKPLGNENVTRENFNENWDIIDLNSAKKSDLVGHQAEKASKTGFGHVQIGDGINVTDGVISVAEMTATNVSTTSGSNVQTEIDNLKSSVSNGKVDVRNAITGKGGTVADADGDGVPTHAELAAGVQGIITPKTDDMVFADEGFYSGSNLRQLSYNDESDDLAVAGYSNSTGGDYRVYVVNKSGSIIGMTGNLGSQPVGIVRDDTKFYVSIATGVVYCFLINNLSNYNWFKNNGSGNTHELLFKCKGKLVGPISGGGTLHVMNIDNGNVEKTLTLSPASLKMVMDDEGYLYTYDNNAAVKKYDVLGPKSDNSLVWTATGFTVSGSGAGYIQQSKNHIFVITTNSEISKIRKTDGVVVGTKNVQIAQSRVMFDQFDNAITWTSGQTQMILWGKEEVVTQKRAFNTVNYNFELKGKKRVFSIALSQIKSMSPFYKV